MKMVKSALLLSAAGLVAASGAQAADLPVKAKPVEYVKVCSLYGAGFYYIPGTDICMKVGGYVRFQEFWGQGSDITRGPFSGAGARNTRSDSADFASRSRGLATFDTRQQTAYGTLRTYLIVGFNQDSVAVSSGTAAGGTVNANGVTLYANRAFIQLAGFTFGKATSFFDFVSTAAVAYNAGNNYAPDTGDAGQVVASYTAQFGNGLSATIGAEQARRNSTTYIIGGAATANDNLGGVNALQDIVGNVRVDQAWGSAQISGALHDVSAAYYGSGVLGVGAVNEANGHPGDKWGWAVSAGLRLNAPMFGPGDYFQGAVVYAEGATKYAVNTPTPFAGVFNGNSVGMGVWEDAIFTGTAATPGSYDLTTAWSLFASYEHFWTPNLRTSVYGSYLDVSRSANANTALCSTIAFGSNKAGSFSSATGCNQDFSAWNIGSRSQWNITKDLYVGLDVIYQKLNSASLNTTGVVTTATSPGGAKSAGIYQVGDQDAWMATWRIHRDIVP